MKIADLMGDNNAIIMVHPEELKEFAMELADEVIARYAALHEENKKQPAALLTTKETTERLGVDASTLWRWAKSGYLIPVKIGVKTRYRESDVAGLMEG